LYLPIKPLKSLHLDQRNRITVPLPFLFIQMVKFVIRAGQISQESTGETPGRYEEAVAGPRRHRSSLFRVRFSKNYG